MSRSDDFPPEFTLSTSFSNLIRMVSSPPVPHIPQAPFVIEDITRDAILAERCYVADSFWARLRGLISRASLPEGEGLLLLSTRSVHTHFMRFPIDVLYLDEGWKVVDMDVHMKPWRIGRVRRRSRSVLELPAGTLERAGVQVGDEIRWKQVIVNSTDKSRFVADFAE